MITELRVGDLFRITGPNPNGGSMFGTTGDVGKVTKISFDEVNILKRIYPQRDIPARIDMVYFTFESVNENVRADVETRLDYLRAAKEDNQPLIYIAGYMIEPFTKEYELDQKLDEGEDLL